MSFEIATVLAVSGSVIFLSYMAVNSNLQKHLRTFFLFMSLFAMIILINEAMLLARDATANTNLDTLLSTVHITLIWFFLFIGATFAIVEFAGMFKNGKISITQDTYRTR